MKYNWLVKMEIPIDTSKDNNHVEIQLIKELEKRGIKILKIDYKARHDYAWSRRRHAVLAFDHYVNQVIED